VLSFAPDGRAAAGSTSLLTDRFYDMGWRDLPPTAGASKLLSTEEGDQFAVVAGLSSTTVIRLKGSGGPGASVIGLLGDFTQQSESENSGLTVCRSGSNEGAVSVNAATRDETAQSPDDYVAVSSVVSWGAGESGCKLIPITVKVDDRSESIESLWVELSNAVGAGLGMDKARLYIVDVQAPTPPPTAAAAPGPAPTTRGESNRGGGGAAGSVLLVMLSALACRRRRRRG
jgi:hypothetical protein